MFRESLLVTSAGTIAQRSCATLMSLTLEMAGIATLIIVPLFVGQAVPIIEPPTLPHTTSLTPDQIREAVKLMGASGDVFDDGKIHAPGGISGTITIQRDSGHPRVGRPAVDTECLAGGCVYDPRITSSATDKKSVLAKLFGPEAPVRPVANAVLAPSKPMQLSHMDPGMLITRIEPRYPETARRARIQGKVVLSALIGKDGGIFRLGSVTGHPWLVAAAVDAVRQWRYRPTMLNGQPVEVETQVEVVFTLH